MSDVHTSTSPTIPDGIYTLKQGTRYLTANALGLPVTLNPIGIPPPQPNQKFAVKFFPQLGVYRICRCANARGDGDDSEAEVFDEDEEEEFSVDNCLSYREARIHQPIIIGTARPFHIVKNGTLYGLKIPNFTVGLAPGPPPTKLILQTGAIAWFEFLKVRC